jgi:hypothetical protein
MFMTCAVAVDLQKCGKIFTNNKQLYVMLNGQGLK